MEKLRRGFERGIATHSTSQPTLTYCNEADLSGTQPHTGSLPTRQATK